MTTRCRPVVLASLAAGAALSLLLAACGSGGPARVASVASSSTTATIATGAVAFARCMRAHGFRGWPDPESSGVFDKAKLRRLGFDPSRMRAVEDGACSHLLPTTSPQDTSRQTQTRVADALSFARCMRGRGVTRFPDPTAQGQLTVEMVQAQGIDVHSPRVLRAVQECLPASHGALTPAKVREALARVE